MDDRHNPLAADLDHILVHGEGLWEELRGGRIFITGGTGFVGRWMLESLLWVNERLQLDVSAVALTRSPARFADRNPHIAAAPELTLLEGDVSTFAFPDGPFTHVLHMATETNVELSSRRPSLEFDTAVNGTRHMLEFARNHGVEHFLYTSSGAIYGRQPVDCENISEDDPFAPHADDAGAAYAHGKRAAEFLCAAAHTETGIRTTIARLFSFVGPYLDIDAGYAVGNFIRDAMRDSAIRIAGDGTPRRSYLYSADLALWLWTILLRGKPGWAYNVGSEEDVSILDLAHTVAGVLNPDAEILVAQSPVPGTPPSRYVPGTQRARSELGLRPIIGLEDGIRRTASWHAGQHANGSGA